MVPEERVYLNRRDFLKMGSVAAGAALLGPAARRLAAGAEVDEVLTLPFKGDLLRRQSGELLLLGRGLLASTSQDGGRSWSRPEIVLNHGEPVRSDSHVLGLERLASGRIALAYGRMQPVNGLQRQEIFLRLSDDDGRSWSEEKSVTPLPWDDLHALHGSLIQLRSGRLLLPAYTHFAHDYVGRPRGIGHTWLPEYCATHMLLSDDEGETWEPTGALFLWKELGHGGLVSCEEPCVAETRDGRLLMLARTTNMRLLRSYSEDGGASWSLVELTDISSSNAPARLVRLPSSGDLLIVWNQATADEHRRGFGRSRLSASVSKDSGATWEHFRSLELCPGMDPRSRLVDPEPPGFVRTGESTHPGQVPDNPARGIVRASYPNVHVVDGKVWVDHDHWLTPNLWAGAEERREVCQRLHVLPVEWFYS